MPELIEERETVERRQRLYFEVPNPRAWFCLGQPEARGYRGVSLGAADNLFVSVKGQALHQAVGSVQHVSMDTWYQSSTNDSVVNSGANAIVTSNKQTIVIAGAGYGPDVQLELGDSPPGGYFNPTDYQDIMNPCRDGVRAYDTGFTGRNDDFRKLVGYEVSASVAAAEAAAGFAASVLAKMFGTPVPPTANSHSIEQFARKHEGLYGKLMTLKRISDRLERWTSRPGTMPGAIGQLQTYMGDFGKAIKGLTSAYSESVSLIRAASPGFMPDGTVSKGGFFRDYAQEVKEARNNSDTSRGDADWTKSANAVAALASSGLRHILRPLANRIRAVSKTIQSLAGILDSIAGLLGVVRKTSSLALVGKEGVSIVSPRRVFGYAADGFHFVTAAPGVAEKDWLSKLAAMVPKLPLGPPPPPDPVPGFTVRSGGDIVMSSEGRVSTSALGPSGRMQMMSQGVAEFGAVDSAALTARRGTAEVLGKKVVLGSTVKRAKAMAMNAPIVASATATMDATAEAMKPVRADYEALVTQLTKDQEKLNELTNKVSSNPVLNSRVFASEIGAMSAKIRAADEPIRLLKVSLEAASAALQEATALRNGAEGATQSAASSAVADGLGWVASKQSLADSVEIGAAASVGVYSADEVTVGAAKKIELVTESSPPIPTQTMKITMGTEIEIAGGAAGLVKIQITGTGITIKAQATEIKSDGVSLELTAGPSKVTIGPAGIVLKGLRVTLDAPQIVIA
jgi:hypothetical protein